MDRFNPPPGWPPPPDPSWLPEAGWRPDPAWPAAPAGWQWYVPAEPAAWRVPGWLAGVALLVGVPWVGLWLMVSLLIPMSMDVGCVGECHDTLFEVSIFGTWALEAALAGLALYLTGLGRRGGALRLPLAYAVLVVGIPVVCISGWLLAAYSLGTL